MDVPEWRCYWCPRCEIAGRDRAVDGEVHCWNCGGKPSATWAQTTEDLAQIIWVRAPRK